MLWLVTNAQAGGRESIVFPVLQVIGQLGTTVGVLWEDWSSMAQQLGLAAAHEQHLLRSREGVRVRRGPLEGLCLLFLPVPALFLCSLALTTLKEEPLVLQCLPKSAQDNK